MFRIIKDNLFLWFLLFLAVVSPSFFFGAFQLVLVVIAAFVVVILIGMVWLRWKVRQMQKGGGGAHTQYTYTSQQGHSTDGSNSGSTQRNDEGNPDVKIFVKPTEKRVSERVGDYVDFEEVPDDEDK